MQAAAGFTDDRPLWKRKHAVLGFVTQFMYVGAQVTVATFVINCEPLRFDDSAEVSALGGRVRRKEQRC